MTENISKRIFIVEDDSFLGDILSEELKMCGFDIKLITSGNEALEIMREDVPDMLVLDIFLPGMNGIELLEELRKDEKTKGLKVLVVSNTDHEDIRKKISSLNATFIMKAATGLNEVVDAIKDKLNS